MSPSLSDSPLFVCVRVCVLWRGGDRSPNAAGWRKVNGKQKVPMEEVYDICQDPGWAGDSAPPFCRPRVTHRTAVAEVVTTPWHFLGNGGWEPDSPRTFKTHTYFWVNLSEGSGGHFVWAVCSFSVQKCQRLAYCFLFLFFPPSPLSSGSWTEEGQLTWQGRQTNKQKELKWRKTGQMKCGGVFFFVCVFFLSVWGLMACSSHYSLLCPLPPIGCNNTAWHCCQCHVISYFCLTTRTTRATSHQDQFTISQAAVFAQGGKGHSQWIW